MRKVAGLHTAGEERCSARHNSESVTRVHHATHAESSNLQMSTHTIHRNVEPDKCRTALLRKCAFCVWMAGEAEAATDSWVNAIQSGEVVLEIAGLKIETHLSPQCCLRASPSWVSSGFIVTSPPPPSHNTHTQNHRLHHVKPQHRLLHTRSFVIPPVLLLLFVFKLKPSALCPSSAAYHITLLIPHCGRGQKVLASTFCLSVQICEVEMCKITRI